MPASFARWEPAKKCTGGPQPGARAFLAWALATQPHARNDGIYNCRNVRGGSTMSAHAEGRAIDVGFPLVDGRPNPAGTALVQVLRPIAAKLGIGCIIWNRRIWSAKSPGRAGRPYAGADPHTGHVHVELTRKAAAVLNLATIKHHVATAAQRPARATLRRGDHGPAVEALQKLLHVTVDGVFGPKTVAAVNKVKTAAGGPADGIAGPNTWAILEGRR